MPKSQGISQPERSARWELFSALRQEYQEQEEKTTLKRKQPINLDELTKDELRECFSALRATTAANGHHELPTNDEMEYFIQNVFHEWNPDDVNDVLVLRINDPRKKLMVEDATHTIKVGVYKTDSCNWGGNGQHSNKCKLSEVRGHVQMKPSGHCRIWLDLSTAVELKDGMPKRKGKPFEDASKVDWSIAPWLWQSNAMKELENNLEVILLRHNALVAIYEARMVLSKRRKNVRANRPSLENTGNTERIDISLVSQHRLLFGINADFARPIGTARRPNLATLVRGISPVGDLI